MNIARYYRPFTIYRQTPGASAVDEPTFEEVGTYGGFIQPVTEAVTTNAEGFQQRRTHRLYCSVGVPIEFGDEVRQDSIKFRAISTTQPRGVSAVDHHKEVDLEYVV
jgi:hypothetical protein